MGTKIVLQHNPSEADIRPPLAFMSTRLSRKIYISEARLQALRVRRQRLDQLFRGGPVARWPGGQSHLSSRKIYLSEARLQALRVRRQRLDQLFRGGQVAGCPVTFIQSENLHLRKPPLVNSRWPGGRVASHFYLVGNLHLGGVVARFEARSASHSISLSHAV